MFKVVQLREAKRIVVARGWGKYLQADSPLGEEPQCRAQSQNPEITK